MPFLLCSTDAHTPYATEIGAGDDTIIAVWDAYLREVGVASLIMEVIPTLHS